jgi:hypothetical protein
MEITGSIFIGNGTVNVQGALPPVPIVATAGATTSVLAQQNTAISSFSPFSSVTGGSGVYTYFVSSGTLPTSVTLNSSTGVVSGTPSAVYAAADVVFSVKDSLNVVALTTSTVNFTVRTGISSVAGGTTTISAIQNSAISSFNAFTSVSNGYSPYTYFVSSGTLPAGVTIDSTTGVVSGTPTNTYATSSVVFSVKDSQNFVSSTTTSVSFTVNAAISATAGATTTVSVTQNSAITSFNPFASVAGGYTPYTYYIVSGTLPTGVTQDSSTGTVSGTATAIQSASDVVFGVKDVQNSSAATTVTVSFTVIARSPYAINYLVVAGGGGGGKSQLNSGGPGIVGAGGGGGGGVIRGCYTQSPGTVLSITIGPGGPGGGAPGLGTQGTPSTLTGATTAIGGGYGAGWPTPGAPSPGIGGPGGNGGGGVAHQLNPSPPFPGLAPSPGGTGSQGFGGGSGAGAPGGPPFPAFAQGGGGGGGGGAAATGGSATAGGSSPAPACFPGRTGLGGTGGAGYTWPFTNLAYGAGGGGAQVNNPLGSPASPGGGTGYGNGGAGGGPVNASSPGSAGSAGVVILAMPTSDYSGTKSGGSVSNPPAAPGKTVITWTSPGSYTV